MQCMQGAIGKLTLLKDKASEGVHKVRKKVGRNKDTQCRLHLKVRELLDRQMYACAHVEAELAEVLCRSPRHAPPAAQEIPPLSFGPVSKLEATVSCLHQLELNASLQMRTPLQPCCALDSMGGVFHEADGLHHAVAGDILRVPARGGG